MRSWTTRIRGALGLGLTWALAGFAAGLGIELIHNLWPNPIGGAVDIWPAALAYPGFLGGLAFSAVLGVVGRRRRFDELSYGAVTAAGALGGALVALIPAVMVVLGLATPNVPLWEVTLALLAPFTVGGAAAAVGTLALARKAETAELSGTEGRQRLDSG